MEPQHTVRPITVFDAVLIAALIAGSLIFFPLARNNRPATITVIRNNVTIATYPLSSDQRIFVKGMVGPMELEIKNKTVRVISSTCPRRICLFNGSIARTGQQIICSPNHVLVEILPTLKDGPDAVTR